MSRAPFPKRESMSLDNHDFPRAHTIDRLHHGIEKWKVGFEGVIGDCYKENGERQSLKILLGTHVLIDGEKNIEVTGNQGEQLAVFNSAPSGARNGGDRVVDESFSDSGVDALV